jgi:hypothetical protein
MNRLFVCLTAGVALATSRAQPRPSPISEDFKAFLARFEKGTTGFVNGKYVTTRASISGTREY